MVLVATTFLRVKFLDKPARPRVILDPALDITPHRSGDAAALDTNSRATAVTFGLQPGALYGREGEIRVVDGFVAEYRAPAVGEARLRFGEQRFDAFT